MTTAHDTGRAEGQEAPRRPTDAERTPQPPVVQEMIRAQETPWRERKIAQGDLRCAEEEQCERCGRARRSRIGWVAAFDPPEHQRSLCQREPQPDVGANQRRRADDGALVQPHPGLAESGAARLRSRGSQGNRQGVDGPAGSADYQTDVDLRRRILPPQARRVPLPRQQRPRPGRQHFAPRRRGPPPAAAAGAGTGRIAGAPPPIPPAKPAGRRHRPSAPASGHPLPDHAVPIFPIVEMPEPLGQGGRSKDRTSSACSKPGRAITASCGIHNRSNSGKDRRRTCPAASGTSLSASSQTKATRWAPAFLSRSSPQRVAVGIGVRHLVRRHVNPSLPHGVLRCDPARNGQRIDKQQLRPPGADRLPQIVDSRARASLHGRHTRGDIGRIAPLGGDHRKARGDRAGGRNKVARYWQRGCPLSSRPAPHSRATMPDVTTATSIRPRSSQCRTSA